MGPIAFAWQMGDIKEEQLRVIIAVFAPIGIWFLAHSMKPYPLTAQVNAIGSSLWFFFGNVAAMVGN